MIHQKYPCTECSGDATIGYSAKKGSDWNGKVKIGERLCTSCFQKRGGENFFGSPRNSKAPPVR